MKSHRTLNCLGYASGIASSDSSCCMGPLVLQLAFTEQAAHLPPLAWRDMLYPLQSEIATSTADAVAEVNHRLARHTREYVAQGELFLVLGGDHSSAIGTWSGAAHALAAQGDLGLIWIDAHLDSHTPETSHSHNIHGMPLAVLLGHGDTRLTHLLHAKPKLRPDKICIIGARHFESEEHEFVKRLGIRIFYMDEVKQRGLDAVLQDALAQVKEGTVGYGISLDVDAIDPADAPGTGIAVPDGMGGQALCEALQRLHLRDDAKLLGLEIAEFNPGYDQDRKTEKLVLALINSVFSDSSL